MDQTWCDQQKKPVGSWDDCEFHEGAFCGPDDKCVSAVPAVSEWGLAIMTLLMLTVGMVAFRHRKASLTA